MTEVKTITIKPVTKIKFSGVSSYSNAKTTFESAQLAPGGSYNTGITKEEETIYEEALGLPKGTLNKNNASFWGHILNLTLPMDKSYTMVIDSPEEELRYKIILAHGLIANNELELSKNQKALFYIEDKEAKAKIEELSIDLSFTASEIFHGLTTDEKKGYLKLYGKTGVDTMSDRIIKTELFKEITKDPKKFIELSKNPDITLRIQIQDMLEKGTLKRKGNYYNFEDEVIGTSIDSVVAFFKDIKNQSLKIAAIASNKKTKKD